MDLKDILGEAYTPEIESAIGAAYIPNDGTYIPKINADGELKRLRDDLAAAKLKVSTLETASLSEPERIQKQIDDALAAANSRESDYKRALAKLKTQNALQGFEVDEDTLTAIAGDDPDKAEKTAAGFAAVLNAAILAGEAKANAEHLKNNGTPGGGSGNSITKEAFKAMTIDEKTKLKVEQPELYKQMKEG